MGHVAQVDSLIDAALGGTGGALRVVGPASCGLTTYLQAAAAKAGARIEVRTAASGELPGPFAIALHLLGLPKLTLAAGIGGQRSFFEAGVPGAAQAVAVETLLRATEASVGNQPQLWVIDDIERAGAGARTWLSDVVRAAALPVAVLYGTHDPGFMLLGDEPHVRLPPRPPAPASPPQLPGDPLVATAAAVAGQQFDVADVAAVLGEPLRNCVMALAELERAGVFAIDGVAYRFVRHRDRTAVLAAAAPPVLASLHAEFARLLMARDDDPTMVAGHLAGAGTRVAGDVDWLTAAAEQLVRLDANAAIELLDRALALTADPPRRLSLARVRALATVGRTAEAEALARLLLAQAFGDEAAVLHRDLGMSLFHQGRAAETVTALAAAVEHARDEARRARFTAELAMARLIAADFAGARRDAEAGAERGESIGDPVTVLASEMVVCLVALYGLDIPAVLRVAERIESMADLPEAAEAALYQPWFAASLARIELDQYDHSRRLNAVGRARAIESGHLWMAPAYDALDAYCAWETGDLDDVVACASGALAWRLDDTFGTAIWCHAFLGRVACARGDFGAAAAHSAAAQPMLLPGQAQFGLDHLALLDADLAAHAGDRQGAFAALRAGRELFVALGLASPRQDVCVSLVPYLDEFGDAVLNAAVVGDLRSAAELTGLASFAADHAHATATLAGDWRRLESVADEYHALGRQLRAGRVLAEAARSAEAEDAAEARRLARRAEEVLAPCGAEGDLAAIRHLLAGRRSRGHNRELSRSERAVVALLADGLTNTEIGERLGISRRTVESHVSSAFRKLGVGNRVELTRLLLADER